MVLPDRDLPFDSLEVFERCVAQAAARLARATAHQAESPDGLELLAKTYGWSRGRPPIRSASALEQFPI
jgi:hypothetical protein